MGRGVTSLMMCQMAVGDSMIVIQMGGESDEGGSEFPGKAPLRRESHLVIHWSAPRHDFRHLIIEENPLVNSMGSVPHQS